MQRTEYLSSVPPSFSLSYPRYRVLTRCRRREQVIPVVGEKGCDDRCFPCVPLDKPDPITDPLLSTPLLNIKALTATNAVEDHRFSSPIRESLHSRGKDRLSGDGSRFAADTDTR